MAELGFRAEIDAERTRNTGLLTASIQIDIEVWDGASYGFSQPFQLDTGAEVTTLSTALAGAIGLSTVGGRRVNLRGVAGTTAALLVPFRFRFARWPALEVTDTSSVIVPGERERGLLALRDVHPLLDFFKVGADLFFVPPAAT